MKHRRTVLGGFTVFTVLLLLSGHGYAMTKHFGRVADPVTGAAASGVNSGGGVPVASVATGPSAATVSALERQAGLTPEMKAMGMTINDLRGP